MNIQQNQSERIYLVEYMVDTCDGVTQRNVFFDDVLSRIDKSKEKEPRHILIGLLEYCQTLKLNLDAINLWVEQNLSLYSIHLDVAKCKTEAFAGYHVTITKPIYFNGFPNIFLLPDADKPEISILYIHLKQSYYWQTMLECYCKCSELNLFEDVRFNLLWNFYLEALRDSYDNESINIIHTTFWLSHCENDVIGKNRSLS